MENQNIIRCIICLEEEKKGIPITKLFHIPCNCHIHIHSECFKQCNSDRCLICKNIYLEEKLIVFNNEINNHYINKYSIIYQLFNCLFHFLIYIVGFFILGFITILIGYGIGYFFSCVNVFLDNGYCNKNLFDESNIYIGLFILGIIMACRAESNRPILSNLYQSNTM